MYTISQSQAAVPVPGHRDLKRQQRVKRSSGGVGAETPHDVHDDYDSIQDDDIDVDKGDQPFCL